jgi:hypothetical protein
VPTETTTYPVYDPTSTYDRPVINGYQGMTSAGRAYTEIRAEDGNGTVDRRIDQRLRGSIGIVQRVEQGGATSEDLALRSKILTFYVNKVPRLRRDATFRPRVNDLLSRNPIFVIPADDVDQLDPTVPNRVGGVPTTYGPILERKIAILGKHPATNRDTCYIVPQEFTFPNGITFNIPAEIIAPGNITVRIRLCDCSNCDVLPWTGPCARVETPFRETTPSAGTCVDTDIACRLAAPSPEGVVGAPQAAQRPGPPNDTGRRQ